MPRDASVSASYTSGRGSFSSRAKIVFVSFHANKIFMLYTRDIKDNIYVL